MLLTSSQEYANFRAWVPRNVLSVGVQHPQPWLYYDWGPRSYPQPLVCLHPLIGSPESFFHQIISLAPRGYRVLSVHIGAYWSVSDYCDAFHAFLDMLDLHRIHIYAAGLGALLATQYALRRPERIASIVLTHALLPIPYSRPPSSQQPTSEYVNNNSGTNDANDLQQRSSMPPTPTFVTSVVPYSPSILRWLPPFIVRSAMRALLPAGRTSLEQAHAAEFVINQTMSESRDVLAARLALVVTASKNSSSSYRSSTPFFLSLRQPRPSDTSPPLSIVPDPTRVTLIDTLDRSPSALALSDNAASHLQTSRRAFLKHGGDFPYLSAPDDVNVHLVVHLRRHAPIPSTPMATPPPAKRRPLPVNLNPPTPPTSPKHQQGHESQSTSLSPSQSDSHDNDEHHQRPIDHNSSSSTSGTNIPKTARTKDDLIQDARSIVVADELAAVEQYAYEVNRLREFLPEHDDADLGIVMKDCAGSLDLAVERAVLHAYDEGGDESDFFSRWRAQAMDQAMADLLRDGEGKYVDVHDNDLADHDDDDESNSINYSDPLGGSSTPNPSSSVSATSTKPSSSPRNGDLSPVQKSDSGTQGETDGRGDAIDLMGRADYPFSDGHPNDDNVTSASVSTTPQSSDIRRSRQSAAMSPLMVGRGPTPFLITTNSAISTSGVHLTDGNEDDDGAVHDNNLEKREQLSPLVEPGLLDGVTPSDPLAGADAVVAGGDGKGKPETLIEWKGVLPQNDDDDDLLDVDNRRDNMTGGVDGWEQFRRKQIPEEMEVNNSNGDVDERSTSPEAGSAPPSVRAPSPTQDSTPTEETEEQRRLRMWSMSALTAASNVNR